jgi:hypothetical protein
MKVQNIGDMTEIDTTRKFWVLTAMTMISNFWDVMPCGLVDHYKCF